MIKKNILFITTTYLTGEKIYPIIPSLNKIHNVEVLNLFSMSKNTGWPFSHDPRQSFYNMCDNLNIKTKNGPSVCRDKSVDKKKYSKFFDKFEKVVGNNYDLVILDNNWREKNMGFERMYKYFLQNKIPIIASPHGNTGDNASRLLKRLGYLFDFSFVFGERRKENMIRYEMSRSQDHLYKIDRMFPAGIPSNDKLKEYERGNKYILIIPNFTMPPPNKGKNKNWKQFTADLFEELKLHKLSEDNNCPIVIKRKHRLFYKTGLLESSLKKYKKIVKIIDVCEDDNKLIADAKMVISAPSTLAFKPIQLGVPTVLLRGHGQIGDLADYPGLIRPSYKNILESIKQQTEQGRNIKFIDRILSGGVDYKSIQLHIEYINKVLNGEITCY